MIGKCLLVLGGAGILVQAALALTPEETRINNPLRPSESWNDFRDDLLPEGSELGSGQSLFELHAPHRAADPATVPVRIRQTDNVAAPISSVILVIDENPAPVAAEISFGAAMAPLDFTARVRVNEYSNIRAIAKTEDGMFMNGRFVKAAGGCSAPAISGADNGSMGKMRLRHFGSTKAGRREAQLMIRHPNFSGLQRDQVTHLYIGAHFINKLEAYQGDELLFALEGGISISENPVFRFTYADNGSEAIRVYAEDTKGNVFEQTMAKKTKNSGNNLFD